MNVGDTITVADLVTAWREDIRAGRNDAAAAERSRIAQASFGVDLAVDPPDLASGWIPAWVTDREACADDVRENRATLARLARFWAGLAPGEDPFATLIEAPFAVHCLWLHHREHDPVDSDAVLADLVGLAWNLDPASSAIVSTAAFYRTGPAARIVKEFPSDDEPIACPVCGWTGTVGETDMEYFSQVVHRECPRCEKMLLILT